MEPSELRMEPVTREVSKRVHSMEKVFTLSDGAEFQGTYQEGVREGKAFSMA